MKLTYHTHKDSTGTSYQCVAEERVRDFLGSTLKRGVSGWHRAKGAAKAEALANMCAVMV